MKKNILRIIFFISLMPLIGLANNDPKKAQVAFVEAKKFDYTTRTE